MARKLVTFAARSMGTVEADIGTLAADECLVEARCSLISAGTEGLVFRGEMPDIRADTVLPGYEESFAYPVSYGYALVGTVVEDGSGELAGKRVFCFAPHAELQRVKRSSVVVLPDALDDDDAVFLAAMETALGLAQDGAALAGEELGILGLGVIGLLCAALSVKSYSRTYALDPVHLRRSAAEVLGCIVAQPAEGSLDLVFELSGSPGALQQAIRLGGFGSRIVLGSWYGSRPVSLDLGGEFHRSRKTLVSSQVSTIDARLSARWTKQRRLGVALDALAQIQPSRWITHRFPLEMAQLAFETAIDHPEACIAVLLNYRS